MTRNGRDIIPIALQGLKNSWRIPMNLNWKFFYRYHQDSPSESYGQIPVPINSSVRTTLLIALRVIGTFKVNMLTVNYLFLIQYYWPVRWEKP